jgi:transcription elongation factor
VRKLERMLVKSVFGRVVLDTDVDKCVFEVIAGETTEVRATVAVEVVTRVREHIGELHAFWFHAAGKSWLSDPVVEIGTDGQIQLTFAGRFDYPKE